MANYLTIQEASDVTGKSTRTIRRLCYDDKSKNFITYDEKNRLLVDANYLAQHYPLSNTPKLVQPTKDDNGKSFAKSKSMSIDNDQLQDVVTLQHKVTMLEQELRLKEEQVKQKEEFFQKIDQQKELRIEVLERSLRLLGEGQKNEPVPAEPLTPASQSTEATPEPQPEEPAPKKAWWKFF